MCGTVKLRGNCFLEKLLRDLKVSSGGWTEFRRQGRWEGGVVERMHKKYFKLILEGMIVEARYCIKLGIIGGEEWGGRIFTIAKWA